MISPYKRPDTSLEGGGSLLLKITKIIDWIIAEWKWNRSIGLYHDGTGGWKNFEGNIEWQIL
jgi:hypothetical protein